MPIPNGGESSAARILAVVKEEEPDILAHGRIGIEADAVTFLVECKTVGRPPLEQPRDNCFLRFGEFVESQGRDERFAVGSRVAVRGA